MTMPPSDERLAGPHWCEDCQEDHVFDLAERTRLRDEVERLRGEVSALIIDIGRAHEELRQGWPKMARDANRSAIEQWNRADAAEAEVERLRAKVAAVELLASQLVGAGYGQSVYESSAEVGDCIRAALASGDEVRDA